MSSLTLKSVGPFLAILGVLLVVLPQAVLAEEFSAFSEESEESEEEAARGSTESRSQGEGDQRFSRSEATPRRDLIGFSREELQEAGFLFEDTTRDQQRANATLFALLAGPIVHGAGHWQLDDRRTALFLLTMEVVGLSLIGAGTALALNPTGMPAFDERRRELWFIGVSTLGLSWMIDIFGTAYRDDLGIPRSSARNIGWGGGLGYEYWRPRDLSLRHLTTATLGMKGEALQIEGRTSQELGYGMSDYEMKGGWTFLRGTDSLTSLGVELSGRYVQYRLDDPFERFDTTFQVRGSFNLGRFFAHLDQFKAGAAFGVGVRGYRFLQLDDQMGALIYGGWYLPFQVFLGLNLTNQLRMDLSFSRWQGDWLERSRNRLGIPQLGLTYRSTDRLDLEFFLAFGDGVSLGAGLKFWVGD